MFSESDYLYLYKLYKIMAIERIEPNSDGWEAFYANHIMRYMFSEGVANKFCASSILDVACGVGYGTKFLSQNVSRRITGVDRDTNALAIAKKSFDSSNIVYQKGDCEKLGSIDDDGFDMVVSFETLEHLKNPMDFLGGCFNNMRAKGVIVISTPNKCVSSPNDDLNWEFHEKEYDALEFVSMMESAGFDEIELYGQKLTDVGKFRAEIRAEVNKLTSNPFVRIGSFFQRVFRGRKFGVNLPDKIEDFEIVKYNSPEDIIQEGITGPFVIVAVAKKSIR